MKAYVESFGAAAQVALRSVEAIDMKAYDYTGQLSHEPNAMDRISLASDDSEVSRRCDVLQAIINTSLDIYLVTDTAGNILEANPAAFAISSKDQLVGGNIATWVIPAHQGNLMSLLHDARDERCDSSDLYDDLWLRCEEAAGTFAMVKARIWPSESAQRGRVLYWILR